MEHFYGFLQFGLHSWCYPWSNLNKQVLHLSYLSQLKVKYNLQNELEEFGQPQLSGDRISCNECRYPECEFLFTFQLHHFESEYSGMYVQTQIRYFQLPLLLIMNQTESYDNRLLYTCGK